MNTALGRVLAFAAGLLLAALTWCAEDAPLLASPTDSPASSGGGIEDAQALIDAGRFAEAMHVLGPLLQGDAADANTLFLYGLAAVGASRGPDVSDETREALLDEAIAVFHAMLVERPGLVRVRLELARAFFLKGEDDLAQRHFEHVLAGDPPEAVVANVQRFMNVIRGRGRWSFNLGLAVAPDSNIGASSDERTIFIFDLPFQRDVQELTTSGVGVSVWGGAEYQIAMSESVRLRAGGATSRREYEGSRFDEQYLSGHLGPRWLVDGSTEGSVLASARQRWTGTVKDHHALGGRLEVGHRVSPRVTVMGQASWHGRRYRTRTGLDGPVWDTSLRGAWVVMPTVRAELSGGYGREPAQRRPGRAGRRPGGSRRMDRRPVRAGDDGRIPRRLCRCRCARSDGVHPGEPEPAERSERADGRGDP